MKKTTLVSNFVEEIFDLYHLNKLGFFYEIDEETEERYEIPLFVNGVMDDETMHRLSIKLGLTSDEILSCKKSVLRKYWSKYSFFKLYELFLEAWGFNSRYVPKYSPAESLIHMLQSEDLSIPVTERYDYAAVKDRMIQQLEEMDAFLPGTFHPGASITNLEIETEVLFSFPEITELLKSFIDMIEKAGALFFKALKEQLSPSEINEYNFLVNALEITDIVMPSVHLTYDNVCRYRKAYIEEGFTDFLKYAKIKSLVGTGGFLCPGVDPWRCKEFFDNIELVEKLAGMFPNFKEQMRRFSLKVKKFACSFIWSDAGPVTYSDEEEQFLKGTEWYVPLNERRKESTLIYVDKTKEELYDWEPYLEKISQAVAPSSEGGLHVRPVDTQALPPYSLARIHKRLEQKQGGNEK